jgi:hypothetical protein
MNVQYRTPNIESKGAVTSRRRALLKSQLEIEKNSPLSSWQMRLAPKARRSLSKHGATPKAFGAESAIHEDLSYSPAQFRKADELPLTSVFSPQAGRGAVLYATFGLESWRTASISTSDMSGIEH